jgi:hypothetical protein
MMLRKNLSSNWHSKIKKDTSKKRLKLKMCSNQARNPRKEKAQKRKVQVVRDLVM